MNNSNFGYDCRNSFDNCFLTPVIDELEEISYIRKHQSVFDSKLKDFFLARSSKGKSTKNLTIKFHS